MQDDWEGWARTGHKLCVTTKVSFMFSLLFRIFFKEVFSVVARDGPLRQGLLLAQGLRFFEKVFEI